MEHVQDIETFHLIDGVQAFGELRKPAGDPGADGLDTDVFLGRHRGDPHIAAEVFHEHLTVSVIAQDLLDELIQSFPGPAEAGKVALPEGVDNLEVAIQGGKGLIELFLFRFHLQPQRGHFRSDVRADIVGMLRRLARRTGRNSLLLQTQPCGLGYQGVKLGSEASIVLSAQDLSEPIIAHSALQAADGVGSSEVGKRHLRQAHLFERI